MFESTTIDPSIHLRDLRTNREEVMREIEQRKAEKKKRAEATYHTNAVPTTLSASDAAAIHVHNPHAPAPQPAVAAGPLSNSTPSLAAGIGAGASSVNSAF